MGKKFHSQIREQLRKYRQHVSALALQRVWKGHMYRKKNGLFKFQGSKTLGQTGSRPQDRAANEEPFLLKGSDINSELDMYHGPVAVSATGGHSVSIASASPNRSDPLPRRGPRRSAAPRQRGPNLTGTGVASVSMPVLNHAMENGTQRIQAVARGRRARKEWHANVLAAGRIQSTIRRYLAILNTRAKKRRQEVAKALRSTKSFTSAQSMSLHDWLVTNNLSRGSGRSGSDYHDIEYVLREQGITELQQLATLSAPEAEDLTESMFDPRSRGRADYGNDEQVFTDAVTLLRLTHSATTA